MLQLPSLVRANATLFRNIRIVQAYHAVLEDKINIFNRTWFPTPWQVQVQPKLDQVFIVADAHLCKGYELAIRFHTLHDPVTLESCAAQFEKETFSFVDSLAPMLLAFPDRPKIMNAILLPGEPAPQAWEKNINEEMERRLSAGQYDSMLSS